MEADVVILGAGVAGAMLAWLLSCQGHMVLLVEAGPAVSRLDAVGQWATASAKTLLSPYRGATAERFAESPDNYKKDYDFVDGKPTFKSTYLRRVGGSTWHWQGSTPRLIPTDFRMASSFGRGVDWPIDYGELERWYCEAEVELGVAGDHEAWNGVHGAWRSAPFPMTHIWPSHSDRLFAEKANGIPFYGAEVRLRSTPQARNSRPYQGRPPCAGNSICIPLCPIQAKYDATVHVRLAVEAGAQLLDRTVAVRIVKADNGRIDGIELATWNDKGEVRRRIARARRYVVAAHSIESARLLLVSDIGRPSVVGHNLMDHPTGEVVGLASEPVFGFRGPPVTSGIDEWRDGAWRNDHAAWKMSLGNDGHGRFRTPEATVQRWMDQGIFGLDLRKQIESHAPRLVRISWAAEQLPTADNYLELSPQTDELGMTKVRMKYSVDGYTLSAFPRIRDLIAKIYFAAGITDSETSPDPATYGGSGHVMGTCRMGEDPATSVVDATCRVHEHEDLFVVGASVFPTAGTANPTLTVAALSLRLAQTLHEQLPIYPKG
jgi:glucose dehydrogenase